MLKPSLLLSLLQTTLITAGGLLFVNMLATASGTSDGQLLMGPLSVGLVWLGVAAPDRIRRRPQTHDGRELRW